MMWLDFKEEIIQERKQKIEQRNQSTKSLGPVELHCSQRDFTLSFQQSRCPNPDKDDAQASEIMSHFDEKQEKQLIYLIFQRHTKA